jgi:PAS domain S-box-containing protein
VSSSQQLKTKNMESLLPLGTPQPLIVLLVEDCLEDRETIARYLQAEQQNQYKIVEAQKVEEGLALYQQCQPDLVLLDYRLPDADGLEFLEQIEQEKNGSCCPIILLTGQGNEKLAVQAMKAGACDYLVKGQVQPKELRSAVNSAIENARLRAQLRQAQAERDRQIEQEKLIAQIANQIHSRLGIDEILDTTVSQVRQFLKCDRVLIYRFEPDWSRVVVAESVGDGWLSILNTQVKNTDFIETHGEDYRRGRIQAIADLDRANLSESHIKLLKRFQVRAKLAVPILQEDSLWGLLVANQCCAPRQWQPQNIELLQQLTTQVGIAIAQAESSERERIILRMQEQIRRSLNVDEILRAAVFQVRRFLRTDRVLIFRFQADGSGVIVAESVSASAREIITSKIYDPCLVESYIEPFKEGLVTAKADINDGSIEPCHVELLKQFGVQANLVVPILQEQRLWGLLIAHHCVAPRQWRQPEIELLKNFATQVGIALLQGELYERVQIELFERQRTEAALQKANQRIQTTWDSMTDAYVALDCEWRITYTNQAAIRLFERLTNLKPEAYLGKTHWEIFPWSVGKEVEREYRRAIAEQVTVHLEVLYEPTQDWFEVHAYPSAEGLGIYFREINDRKRAEMALRDSERRYATLAQLSPVGIFRGDRDGINCFYANERACEIAGLAHEDILGTDWLDAVHPDDRPRLIQQWQRSIAENKPFYLEYRFLHADGTIRWVIGEAIAETDDNGWVIGYIGAISDISDRKQAEEALREGEQKYRNLFERMDEGFCICEVLFDADGKPNDYRFLEVNPAFERMTGLEQATGKTARELVPDLETFWVEIYGRVALTGEPVRFENQSLAMDRWFDVNAFRIGEPKERKVAILFTNISDRKRTEQSFLESEELLRLGMQVAGFALAKFNYATDTVTLSPEAAALYGLSASELVVPRSRLHATFHPEDRAELVRLIDGILDPTGTGWFARDHRVLWSNGEVRWLSVRKQVFFDRSGVFPRPQYAVLAALDITDRKRAELALRESEERFQTFMNNSPFAAFIKNKAGYLTYTNRRVQELFNKSSGELVGRNDFEILPEAIAREMQEHDRRIFATGEATEFIETVPNPAGELTYWLTIKFLLGDRERQPLLGGIAVDITSRLQTEQQLRQQAQELTQLNAELEETTKQLTDRNEELNRFVYVVSHDLKAPLRAIANLSQWLAEDLEGKLDEDNQHNIELLQNRVERMADMIDGLLVYSRVGRTEVETTTFDVGELLAEILDSLAPPPTFTIEVQSSMPTITAKKLLLSQVFSNLIGNAIKHHPRPDGQIKIGATQKEEYYEFTIKDDGDGIAPENHQQIFKIFQTLKGQDNKDSTGIGLSIVKKIIETEGGELTVESELGGGATFRFTWRIEESG